MRRELRINLVIADISLSIISRVPFEKLLPKSNLFLFKTIHSAPDNSINIQIKEKSGQLYAEGNEYYDPGDMWKLYKDENGLTAVIFDDKNRPKCMIKPSGKWDSNDLSIKFYGDEDKSIIDSGALELIFRTHLIHKNGVIFHSSLVDDNGSGILFTGNSGDGKSTQSMLWQGLSGAEIINEDRNAVRVTDEGIFGYGTPWGGTAKKVVNKKVKIKAIILITKSQTNSIEKLSEEKSVPMLITRSFFPYWDNELAQKAVNIITSVVKEIPVYMLYCKPGKEVVELVRSVI